MTKDKEFLKKELGERLRSALKAKNIKFMDVARDLGVSPQAVTFWLKGQKDPAFSNIALIAQKYGLNPVYLLLGEGPPLLPREDKNVLAYTGKKNFPGKRKKSFWRDIVTL